MNANAQRAADIGYLLATGTAAHTLVVEASITNSPISPTPVALEPAFRAFDPLQTFEPPRPALLLAAARAPHEWIVQRLILPSADAVDWRQAEGFLAGLAGSQTPISFEVYAARERADFFLGSPPAQRALVANAWLAAYPQSALTTAPDPLNEITPADLALCDLYSPAPYHRSMRSRPSVSPWRQFLRLCKSLRREDALFAQVIFTPARHPWHENIKAILQAERFLGPRSPHGITSNPKDPAEPIFAASVRIGSTDPALAGDLEAFAGTFTADGKPLRYRTTSDYDRVLQRADTIASLRERTSHTTGQLLTTSELSVFVHPPDQAAAADGFRLTFLRGLPVPQRLRQPGRPLGTNNDRGEPITVFQPSDQPNRSEWLIGQSRKGKSTKIINDYYHLAKTGQGVGLIDPHRTTAADLLRTLDGIDPARVVFLDFDAANPVAFNPFDHDNEDDYGRLTTEYVNSLSHLFDAERFHRMTHILGMSIYALFPLKANLVTLPDLLSKTPTGESLRRRVAAIIKNDAVRHFWHEEYYALTSEATAPLLNRLSAVLLDDKTHRTFSQQHNKVDIARAMDEGQVVIIATPASIEAAKIVGGIIIAQAKHAAYRRAGTPRAKQHFHLVIDEFPRFVTSSNSLQSIIDETAKGGLSVGLANQETGQIPNDLLKAMFSIPNIFVFGVNLPDAKTLSHLFNGAVTPETLSGQGTGEVYARIDGDITNFTCQPPIATNPGVAERIIAHSNAHYYNTTTPPPPRPASARRVIETIPEE